MPVKETFYCGLDGIRFSEGKFNSEHRYIRQVPVDSGGIKMPTGVTFFFARNRDWGFALGSYTIASGDPVVPPGGAPYVEIQI